MSAHEIVVSEMKGNGSFEETPSGKEAPMEPQLRKIKSGWAALADHWAVFAATQEEALAKFREAEAKRKEIASRKMAPTTSQ